LKRAFGHNLADYLVPVNADIQQLEVILVPELIINLKTAKTLGLAA